MFEDEKAVSEYKARARAEYAQTLKWNVATITFTKRDGTERVMRCTLKEEFLPRRDPEETTAERDINLDTLSVWDLDKGAWRSFRIDSIKRIVVSPV